jgi:hypothetical protein
MRTIIVPDKGNVIFRRSLARRKNSGLKERYIHGRMDAQPGFRFNLVAPAALGGFQRVDLPVSLSIGGLYMGGHVTGTETPFDGRIREIDAVCTGGKLLGSLATFTLFNDGVAVAAVELTTCFFHEETVYAFFYACTKHGYHILSIDIFQNEWALCPIKSRKSRENIMTILPKSTGCTENMQKRCPPPSSPPP